MEKLSVTGYIKNYIYTTTESMYKVCVLVTPDDEEIIIVGNFPTLDEGLNYEFIGSYKTHPKYGKQFFVESYAKGKSFSRAGIISYLSSDKFYGVGEKMATLIVDALGVNCIEVILSDRSKLDNIKGKLCIWAGIY